MYIQLLAASMTNFCCCLCCIVMCMV